MSKIYIHLHAVCETQIGAIRGWKQCTRQGDTWQMQGRRKQERQINSQQAGFKVKGTKQDEEGHYYPRT